MTRMNTDFLHEEAERAEGGTRGDRWTGERRERGFEPRMTRMNTDFLHEEAERAEGGGWSDHETHETHEKGFSAGDQGPGTRDQGPRNRK